MNFLKNDLSDDYQVGIIGGGVAGTTIAMRLSQAGLKTALFEENQLISGPPICHLHAGGNLYREISNAQCQQLLEECIDTRRAFPHVVNERPTVIAIPTRDAGDPLDLLPRLTYLQNHYRHLVELNPKNQQLGSPDDYFKTINREELEVLAKKTQSNPPITAEDWLIPLAKNLDLNQFKYPLILVQEYGLSLFRFAATAKLSLEACDNAHLFLGQKITKIEQEKQGWQVTAQHWDSDQQLWVNKQHHLDYLVNAAGYQTGIIDDCVQQPKKRMVEFKAAYVTHWANNTERWPEVIIHGERGTPEGMAQLTPYADNHFQLHGMTHNITLFKDGLVYSNEKTAQPQLPKSLLKKIRQGWEIEEQEARTQRAIDHVANFLPKFSSAQCAGKPLFGAQQVPGDDITLRAATVSFSGKNYARAEIVKATSALSTADAILKAINPALLKNSEERETQLPLTQRLSSTRIYSLAESLAKSRGYPIALAKKLDQ